MELADVVIEVLDARDPLPCRSLEVENFVRTCGPQKRIILLLNKIGKYFILLIEILLFQSFPNLGYELCC